MSHSFIKKILLSSCFLLSNLFASQSRFSTRFETRLGARISQIDAMSTHRHRFTLEQEYRNDDVVIEGSIRTEVEGESSTSLVDLRDLYVGWKTHSLNLKFGWQQIAWNESFGINELEFINPQDLRELGLGQPEEDRLTIPLINAKWITAGFSTQFLIIPFPMLSRLPQTDSPYSFPFSRVFGDSSVSLSTSRSMDFITAHIEIGTRITKDIGDTSLALVVFNGLDKNPPFQSELGNPIQITRPFYRRNHMGLSASRQFGQTIVRTELFYIDKKLRQVIGPGLLTFESTPQWFGVVGCDFPILTGQLGLQYLHRSISDTIETPSGTLGVRISGNRQQFEWEVLLNYFPRNGSSSLFPRINFPLSNQLSFSISSEMFLGSATSEMGPFTNASRILGEFRAFLGS